MNEKFSVTAQMLLADIMTGLNIFKSQCISQRQ